jgi:hypothetical protein
MLSLLFSLFRSKESITTGFLTERRELCRLLFDHNGGFRRWFFSLSWRNIVDKRGEERISGT